VVFDITSPRSFNGVKSWVLELGRLGPDDVEIILVGNKSDLESQRRVSCAEALAFAKNRGVEYIECSAMSGANVHKVFQTLAETLFARGGLRTPGAVEPLPALQDEVSGRIRLDRGRAGGRPRRECCP